MRIEIVEIDRNTSVFVHGQACLGYRGRFRCPLVTGTAVIVPYSGREDNLKAGKSISVETDQESVDEFQMLQTEARPAMLPLEIPGDYEVVGVVTVAFEDGVSYVDVGGFSFCLDCQDTGGAYLRVSQWVRFTIRQLSLWDENI